MSSQNRRQLPGEIDRITYPGVHPLTARRTVDVRGIAQQESAVLPEMLGHPVMNVVGREPIYLLDLHLDIVNCPVAYVFKSQLFTDLPQAIAAVQNGGTFLSSEQCSQGAGLESNVA